MALSGKIPEFTSEQCDSMDGTPVGKLIRGFSGMQRLPCSPTKDGGPDTRSANFKELLKRATEGDANSEERLCETVNDELRRVALRMSQRYSSSAQASSLVNEVYLSIFRKSRPDMKGREHFFAIAIEQMRQILRDRWRKKSAQKRGGHLHRENFDIVEQHLAHTQPEHSDFDLEKLDQELERLKEDDASNLQYKIIKFRFFGGLSVMETADILGLSKSKVEREWRLARAKLFTRLTS